MNARHIARSSARSAPLIRTLELLDDRVTPASLVVTNGNDAGAGSLREAIGIANANGETDTITFAPDVKTVTLTTNELLITSEQVTTIDGGASGVTVTRDGSAPRFRILDVPALANNAHPKVDLIGLTISNGYARIITNPSPGEIATAGEGGGLRVRAVATGTDATVTITNCTFTGNTAVSGAGIYANGHVTMVNTKIVENSTTVGGQVGGVWSTGSISMTNCTISGNSGDSGGGGIEVDGTATLSNCAITGNTSKNGFILLASGPKNISRGGGIVNRGTMNLINCKISDNSTSTNLANQTANGGGIYNVGGKLSLLNCTITGNTASGRGGGILSGGDFDSRDPATITMENCSVTGNTAGTNGGGICNGGGGSLNITNSTVSGNKTTSGNGGGISAQTDSLFLDVPPSPGIVTVTNCTISGNVATGSGGGIAVDLLCPTTVTNVTIAANRADSDGNGSGFGGGAFNSPGGTLTAFNTIISGNFRGTGTTVNDTNGTLAVASSHNLIGGNAKLGPLADNEGRTLTHALLPGSPAVDAGDNTKIVGINTDQRGTGFERILGGTVDIGAVEGVSAASITGISTDTGVSTTDEVTTDTTLILFGTTLPDNTVRITLVGVGEVGTTSSDASGRFAFDFTGTTLTDGQYQFTAISVDTLGNQSATSRPFTVTIDTTSPTVIVEQQTGQADPTDHAPILFTATFSEPVIGLSPESVALSGTAGTTTVAIANPSDDQKTFVISVTGVTQSGTVIASVQAGAVTDSAGNVNMVSTSIDNTVTVSLRSPPPVSPPPVSPPPVISNPDHNYLRAVGADAGGGPRVRAFRTDGSTAYDFFVYEPTFHGGVRVATGDVNGDGTDDILAAAGDGGGPRVVIFDGATGQVIRNFFAFDDTLRVGVFVASADANGDGFADYAVTAGSGGGPRVSLFDGKTGNRIGSDFLAFDANSRTGFTIAMGDITNSGHTSIIVGQLSGGSTVRVFDLNGALQSELLVFESSFLGGVHIAVGDMNGDGWRDLLVGAGPGGGPRVRGFQLVSGNLIEIDNGFSFDSATRNGVRVGSAVSTNRSMIVVSFAGHTRSATVGVPISGDEAPFGDDYLGGVWVS